MAVEKQTGLQIDRQRIAIVDAGAHNPFMKLFWSVARVVYVVLCALVALTIAWSKWVLVGPSDGDRLITLSVQVQETKDVGARDDDGGVGMQKKGIEAGTDGGMTESGDAPSIEQHRGWSRLQYRTSDAGGESKKNNNKTTMVTKTVTVTVRPDVTLGELQHQLQLQHGDGVNLQGLVVLNTSGEHHGGGS